MAPLHRRTHDQYEQAPDDRARIDPGVATVDDRTTLSAHEGWNSAVRVIASVVAAVAVVIGVVALFRVDWNAGLDAIAVDVMGMAFTPIVAMVTVVAGVVALVAAASPERTSKIVVGAVLACVGIGILLASSANQADLRVEDAHGWLALAVGAVLLVAGLVLRTTWTSHRQIRSGDYAH